MNKLANARSRVTAARGKECHLLPLTIGLPAILLPAPWSVYNLEAGFRDSFSARYFFFMPSLFLESARNSFLRENRSFHRKFSYLCKIFLKPGETLPAEISSIQAQLFTGLLKARFRKNPAVAAAGS